MKNIEKLAKELDFDLEKVNKELKRVASIKCRTKKAPGKKGYEEAMMAILKEEEMLKQVKQLLTVKPKFVTEFTQEDVDKLDFDETMKAIKSIQSKKTNSAWLTSEFGDNDEFRRACEIEKMLLEHKKSVKPVEDSLVRKSEIQAVIETIEQTGDITKETILEILNGLL